MNYGFAAEIYPLEYRGNARGFALARIHRPDSLELTPAGDPRDVITYSG